MGWMKKVCVMLVAVGIVLILGNSPVQAAKKKLSVNKVYDTTTKIKGTTSKKALVKIKIGKKIYKKRAGKKGKFQIKIRKQKVGKSFWVRTYQKKHGKWKLSKKKKVYVLTKKLIVKPFSKNDTVIRGYSRPNVRIGIIIIPRWFEENGEQAYMDFPAADLETDDRGRFVARWSDKIGDSVVHINSYKNSKTFSDIKIKPYDV